MLFLGMNLDPSPMNREINSSRRLQICWGIDKTGVRIRVLPPPAIKRGKGKPKELRPLSEALEVIDISYNKEESLWLSRRR